MLQESKEQRIEKEQNKIMSLLFIPIMMLLAIVPLIVRYKEVTASQIVQQTLGSEGFGDFYSQYKAIFIIGLGICMLMGLFLTLNKRYIKKDRQIMIYAISGTIFTIFTVLSSLFSPYKEVAMWGMPDRAEGMVVILCYVLMLFYMVYAFQKIKCYKYIVGALSVVIISSTLIGITQYIGKDFFVSEIGKRLIVPSELAEVREGITISFEKTRVTGTMFNPNYIGSFTAMMIPLFATLTLAIKEKKIKVVSFFLTLCSVFLLFGSGSRAGILGLGAAVIVIGTIFLKKAWQKKKIFLLGVIVTMVGIGILGFATKGIMFSKVGSLIADSIAIFKPVDSDFNYKDELPIRDINTEDGRLTIVTQQSRLIVDNTSQDIVFMDHKGNSIEYEIINDVYITKDERFSNIKFTLFYQGENSPKRGGLGLVVDDKGLFVFRAVQGDAITLVDSFTQKEIAIDYPETIGFRGKERLGSMRGYIWSRSLPLLKDTLLVGSGPDTYAMVFPQRDYFGKYYAFGETSKIVDKPHNLYLQIGINQGVIALIAFLVLVLVYVADSFRLYALKSYYRKQDILGIATMVAVVGYLVAGVFNDSVVSVAPIFWLLLGAGIAINYLVTHQIEE